MSWILTMDQSLFVFINSSLSNSIFDIFFPFITDLHKSIFFILSVYPLVLFLLVKTFGKKGVLIFLFCFLSLATIDLVGNYGFKKTVQRLRPGDNPAITAIVRSPYGGYSFISNHAANMFGFAVFIGFFLTSIRRYLFAIAILIAFSRVYNGVHFPSDVIAGALVGVAISLLYLKIFNYLFSEKKTVTQ